MQRSQRGQREWVMKRRGVSYRATVDEEVDLRKWKISTFRPPIVLLVSIWLAIGTYLALGGLRPAYARLVIALLVGGTVGYGIAMLLRPRKRTSRPRRRNGRGNATQTVEYRFELRAEGLRIQRDGVAMTVAWTDVKDIDDSDGDIVIQTRYDRVVIRKRAFRSSKSRDAFVAAMRKYQSAG